MKPPSPRKRRRNKFSDVLCSFQMWLPPSCTSVHALLVPECLLCLSNLSVLCLVLFVHLLAAQGLFFRSMTFCIIVICVISGGIKLSAGCFLRRNSRSTGAREKIHSVVFALCCRCKSQTCGVSRWRSQHFIMKGWSFKNVKELTWNGFLTFTYVTEPLILFSQSSLSEETANISKRTLSHQSSKVALSYKTFLPYHARHPTFLTR